MDDVGRTASPTCYGWPAELAPVIGAAVAVTVAALYGRPLHAMVTFWLMAFATGLGISLGFHRLFAHRSFATYRPVECGFMILGCMAGGAPFSWIATHRAHHRHSDSDHDPHSPYIRAGRRLGLLRGFRHSYFEWLHAYGYAYQPSAVRDSDASGRSRMDRSALAPVVSGRTDCPRARRVPRRRHRIRRADRAPLGRISSGLRYSPSILRGQFDLPHLGYSPGTFGRP